MLVWCYSACNVRNCTYTINILTFQKWHLTPLLLTSHLPLCASSLSDCWLYWSSPFCCVSPPHPSLFPYLSPLSSSFDWRCLGPGVPWLRSQTANLACGAHGCLRQRCLDCWWWRHWWAWLRYSCPWTWRWPWVCGSLVCSASSCAEPGCCALGRTRRTPGAPDGSRWWGCGSHDMALNTWSRILYSHSISDCVKDLPRVLLWSELCLTLYCGSCWKSRPTQSRSSYCWPRILQICQPPMSSSISPETGRGQGVHDLWSKTVTNSMVMRSLWFTATG